MIFFLRPINFVLRVILLLVLLRISGRVLHQWVNVLAYPTQMMEQPITRPPCPEYEWTDDSQGI